MPTSFLRVALRPPTPGTPTLLRHSIAITSGAGILTRFPSTTRFRLALGTDSPCADERCARKPWAFGVGAFHPHYRYLCQHSHFSYLHDLSRVSLLQLRERSATACESSHTPVASVDGLSPVTFSAQNNLSRLVSYYAFFKGWLLLSQPPSCYGLPTSFPT